MVMDLFLIICLRGVGNIEFLMLFRLVKLYFLYFLNGVGGMFIMLFGIFFMNLMKVLWGEMKVIFGFFVFLIIL